MSPRCRCITNSEKEKARGALTQLLPPSYPTAQRPARTGEESLREGKPVASGHTAAGRESSWGGVRGSPNCCFPSWRSPKKPEPLLGFGSRRELVPTALFPRRGGAGRGGRAGRNSRAGSCPQGWTSLQVTFLSSAAGKFQRLGSEFQVSRACG